MARRGQPGQPSQGELFALLDADPHGCALATAIRGEDGEIVDFRLVYLNEAGCRFLQRPPEQLLGRTYRQLWPETVTDGTLSLYRRVVQERVPEARTVYYDRASLAGHFEIRLVPFGDGFVARFVDLSKLTMGSQTDGGTRLYDALDAAFDGFALLRPVRDDTGQVVDFVQEYVNQIGAKLAGRSVEDLVGKRIGDPAGNAAEAALLANLVTVAQTGEPWHDQLVAPDMAQVWELKAVSIDAGYVAVSYRDITEQVDRERELRHTAAQAQAAAERTSALQTVTAALAAASTPDEVYQAMGTVLRPSAGGHGLAVLLIDNDRLVLHYHAGYEQHVVEQLRALPMSHPYPATAVAATGDARYLCSPQEFAAAQPDPAVAVSGGSRAAWAFLPLSTAGQVLGTLVIGYREPREFDPAERANLTAFSRLAAQALQRALLYRAQMSIAADLQRALLPAVLPTLPGARHAVRYLPWTEGAEVGGDWYDVIQIAPRRAVIVIGDVAGHSPQAAAVMGQLRSALRAYAADGYHPAEVLRRASAHLARYEPHAMATCCYLELDLQGGTATAVLAGHPPPLLRADGVARPLPLRVGPPLGIRHAEYTDHVFALPPGCSLVLYTDGLIEDRRYTVDQGLADLCEAVGAAPTDDPEALVEHILGADVGPTPRSDDVAILALTVDPSPRPV
ncbi:SpoIIE family protein phosphatase [Actinoplanes sp. KI2]|uniref:SpoIIE family protein phosphatase n=1 Tax=Actinoplanes sp. KI2 TaxID=2983315 RepID=UPI0021D56D8B|nr:SpoIIE family protein phosphatase [Actinoplanes sp. KI2]MCU7723893.1 SpoIIE family protein phosphatase [Actinoplanes sp. KI2]